MSGTFRPLRVKPQFDPLTAKVPYKARCLLLENCLKKAVIGVGEEQYSIEDLEAQKRQSCACEC